MPIWKVLNSVMLIILKYDALVDDWIQRLFFVNFCSSRLQISLKTYLSYKSISFNHYFPLYIFVCFALRYMLIKNFSFLFRNKIYIWVLPIPILLWRKKKESHGNVSAWPVTVHLIWSTSGRSAVVSLAETRAQMEGQSRWPRWQCYVKQLKKANEWNNYYIVEQ